MQRGVKFRSFKLITWLTTINSARLSYINRLQPIRSFIFSWISSFSIPKYLTLMYPTFWHYKMSHCFKHVRRKWRKAVNKRSQPIGWLAIWERKSFLQMTFQAWREIGPMQTISPALSDDFGPIASPPQFCPGVNSPSPFLIKIFRSAASSAETHCKDK